MQSEDKKNKKQKKSAITYYSIVAFSLAVIGSVSWFAATRASRGGTVGEYSPKDSSYNSKAGSETQKPAENKSSDEKNTDTKSAEKTENTESVAKTVEDQPYEAPAPAATLDSFKFTMTVEGAILKGYSKSDLQYSSTYADMRLHDGIDIACAEGSVVKAAANGTIKEVVDDELYGKVVIIDHGGGVYVRYCGLRDVGVTPGQMVLSGDQIGFSATVPCECADEPHIHIDATADSDIVSAFEILGAGQ